MADPSESESSRRLEDLHTAAKRLNIEVVFSDLGDPEFPARSGLCRLRGRDVIFLDRALPAERQIEVFLDCLKQFDLDSIFLAAWIRERLERWDST
ncbi:MAG: hypothetical protein KC553_02690 [Nitrospina sp.]|nr:hypothetical protein [Nitrospina sp.]